MTNLLETRGGLIFDIVTSPLQQEVDQCKLILAEDREFYKFAMETKRECEKILKSIAEYEIEYKKEQTNGKHGALQ